MNKSTLLILTTLLLARTAMADDLTPTNARSDEPTIALTVSPLMLVVPLAEVTVEARVADKVGVAIVAGIGRFHEMDTNARVASRSRARPDRCSWWRAPRPTRENQRSAAAPSR